MWFSDVPLDINEGARGGQLLSIDAAFEAVAAYEWIEEGKPYREFLIPAAIVNSVGPARIVKRRGGPGQRYSMKWLRRLHEDIADQLTYFDVFARLDGRDRHRSGSRAIEKPP